MKGEDELMGRDNTPMEIERKFLVKKLPGNLDSYPSHKITQGYICTSPVIRVRKWDSDYFFTYKSGGLMAHSEIEAPISAEAFNHLLAKSDGTVISKTRYVIPESDKDELVIELDVFEGDFAGFVMAEVEFPSEELAASYTPPEWFGGEVTYDPLCHNANMVSLTGDERETFLAKYGYKDC